MKCGCKNGKLEEIAKTKVGDTGTVKQTSYAGCTGCNRLYEKYLLQEEVHTAYISYNGPLTKEEIMLHAPQLSGEIRPVDMSRIIADRRTGR